MSSPTTTAIDLPLQTPQWLLCLQNHRQCRRRRSLSYARHSPASCLPAMK